MNLGIKNFYIPFNEIRDIQRHNMDLDVYEFCITVFRPVHKIFGDVLFRTAIKHKKVYVKLYYTNMLMYIFSSNSS